MDLIYLLLELSAARFAEQIVATGENDEQV
jgi:hypothetical protein